MVAININGTIKTYSSVPKSWGNQIGVDYLSESEQNALGFYDVVIPSTNPSQELGDIYFDSTNEVFTYPVESKTFSQTVAELKEQKIANLKAMYNSELAKTDWYVTRKQEKGTAIPSAIQTERDDLRTACSTHETSINAKTTKASIVDYQLPSFI